MGLAILSLATVAVITLVFLASQQLRKGESTRHYAMQILQAFSTL